MAKYLDDDDEEESGQASAATAAVDPLDQYRISPDQLAGLRRKQMILSSLGGLANSLSNGSAIGDFYLGRSQPRQNPGEMFDKMGAMAEQRLKDQAMLKQQAIARPKEALEQQKYDPNSGLTTGQNAVSDAVAKALGNKDLGGALQGKSAAEQEAILGQPSVKELIGLKGAEAKAAGFQEPKFESVAKGLNSEYNGNKLLNMLDQQQAKLNDFDQIMTDVKAGKKKFDKPTYNELNRSLVTIMTQAGTGGLGVQEKNEWSPAATNIKNYLAKLSDKDIDEGTETAFGKIQATRNAIAQALDSTRKNKVARIAQGHMALAGKNPYVLPVIQQNLGANGMSISDLQNFKPYGFVESKGGMHSGGNEQQAQSPGKSGQVKVMKGKESYFVDPKDVEEAQADGFKVVQ